MSEVLLSQWRDRVVECTSEISIVEEDVRAVQAQRQSLKQQIRLYEDNVQKEKTELLAKLEDVEARARDLGGRCDATLRLKEEVERIYVNTLDEYENMHYLVREIKNDEDALSGREGLEVRLQRESLAWADEEHSLRRKLGTLSAELRRARQTQLAELNEAEAIYAAAEQRLRTERLRHQRSRSRTAINTSTVTNTLTDTSTALPRTSGDAQEKSQPNSLESAFHAKSNGSNAAASPAATTTSAITATTARASLHRQDEYGHATYGRSHRIGTTDTAGINTDTLESRRGGINNNTSMYSKVHRNDTNKSDINIMMDKMNEVDYGGAATHRKSDDNGARVSAASSSVSMPVYPSSHSHPASQQQSKYTDNNDMRSEETTLGENSSSVFSSLPLKSCMKSTRPTSVLSRENSACAEQRFASAPALNDIDHSALTDRVATSCPPRSRTCDSGGDEYTYDGNNNTIRRADGVRSAPMSRAVSQALVLNDVATTQRPQSRVTVNRETHLGQSNYATRSAPTIPSSGLSSTTTATTNAATTTGNMPADFVSNLSLDALQQRIRAYSQAASKGVSQKREVFDDHTNEE